MIDESGVLVKFLGACAWLHCAAYVYGVAGGKIEASVKTVELVNY